MKRRATKRVDISDAAKLVALDILVGTDGNVLCAQGFYGHPVLLKHVEEALRQWRFKLLKEKSARRIRWET
jgi:hypothetical protein